MGRSFFAPFGRNVAEGWPIDDRLKTAFFGIIYPERGESVYVRYNPNPDRRNVGDCTVRAISKALDQDWETTYTGLALEGFCRCDMPSANHIWGAYLKRRGFRRSLIPDECPDCYCVSEFAEDHPVGTYILALSGHVVCVRDGDYYDTWDSGGEVPLYYWQRERMN